MKMIKHFPPHLAQLVFLNLDGEIDVKRSAKLGS